MERFQLEFQDAVFFERYTELSAKQIRFYLDLRRTVVEASDPEVKQEIQRRIQAGEGTLGIEEADLIMDFELLCDSGFIRRERMGSDRGGR